MMHKSMKNIQIALIGHKQDQFQDIERREYLKPVLLDNLSYEKPEYSSNALAESRFLLSQEDHFDNTSEIVGTISASWNKKYLRNRIDRLHLWEEARLLPQMAKDKSIVLCAGICLGAYAKPCDPIWTKNFQQHFRNEFKNKTIMNDLLYNITGLRYDGLRPAPYANQFICHKSIFQEFRSFIRNHIDSLIKECTEKLDPDYSSVHDPSRALAYILEEVSMLWWSSKKEMIFVSCTDVNPNWYKKYEK